MRPQRSNAKAVPLWSSVQNRKKEKYIKIIINKYIRQRTFLSNINYHYQLENI